MHGQPQDDLYLRAIRDYGPALARLARAYEADPDQRRDLLQDIHFALWRSLAGFANQCSLRTWIYRVAHNAVISARRRRGQRLVSLDEAGELASAEDIERHSGDALMLDRLIALIARLRPPDDQVMLLYLEDMDAQGIGEITGLSTRAVATRIHRAKALLARQFRQDIP
jgi:RNA polymerase sigma-70 factor (ECF subfamily)